MSGRKIFVEIAEPIRSLHRAFQVYVGIPILSFAAVVCFGCSGAQVAATGGEHAGSTVVETKWRGTLCVGHIRMTSNRAGDDRGRGAAWLVSQHAGGAASGTLEGGILISVHVDCTGRIGEVGQCWLRRIAEAEGMAATTVGQMRRRWVVVRQREGTGRLIWRIRGV